MSDEEEEPSAVFVRSRCIRLFPNKAQQLKLKRWIDTARWTYNRAVEHYKAGNKELNRKTYRAAIVNNSLYSDDSGLAWVRETPYEVRDQAMLDFHKNVRSNRAKQKKDPTFHFDMAFRSRKDAHQSIKVLTKKWGKPKSADFTDVFSSTTMKSAEGLPKHLPSDSTLIRNRLGRYYLCIPHKLRVPTSHSNDSQVAAHSSGPCPQRWIALDPGSRTFQTGYDPSGRVVEWGPGDKERLVRLQRSLDDLVSRSTKVKHHQRYRMNKACARIRQKISDLVDELHKKCARWLCQNYDVILLPVFATAGMVERARRRLGRKAVRQLLTWSHYRFKQRLLMKAQEFPGCQVRIVTEEYTSQTCTACGWLRGRSASKQFVCSQCGQRSDRDHNASRNILLKYISKEPWGVSPRR